MEHGICPCGKYMINFQGKVKEISNISEEEISKKLHEKILVRS